MLSPVVNSEEHRKKRRELYHNVYKNRKRLAAKAYRQRNPEMVLWQEARRRAKHKGTLFSISIEDIQIPEVCPVLGISLSISTTGKPSHGSPSLDRIFGDKGYVKGNVKVISHRANLMKSDGTADEHELIAKYIRGKL